MAGRSACLTGRRQHPTWSKQGGLRGRLFALALPSKGFAAMSITPLMPVYPRCEVRPVRGENCHLISEDGTRYLDFAAGIAVNLLGHSHAGLIGAIQQQAATLMHVSH